MASGFMSSVVTRLFHSKDRVKDKDKDRRNNLTDNISGTAKKLVEDETRPSPVKSPAAAQATPAQVKLRDRTAKTKKRDTPRSSPAGHDAETARTTPRAKRKSPIFASLRKRTRPLSCFVARPESPTELQDAMDGTDSSDCKKGVTPKDTKARHEREKSKNSASRQPREKKPRRPLSCIVQPPSPRSSITDASPALEQRHDTGRNDSPLQHEERYQKRTQRPEKSPRPVSCFVGTPPQRSPPPYSKRPLRSSPLHSSGPLDPAVETFRVGSPPPQPAPPVYLEAASRSYSPSQFHPQYSSYEDSPPRSTYYSHEARQQYEYEGKQLRQPLYASDVPLNSSPYRSDNPRKALHHYDQTSQHTSPQYGRSQEQFSSYQQHPSPYCDEIPRQSTPVTEYSRSSECNYSSGERSYSPGPRRFDPGFTAPAQPYGNRSYDLKTYFPSVTPASCSPRPRPRPRPQSACFLCEPQPCCMEVRRPYRPMSQCFVPGCNLPWYEDPSQTVRQREEHPTGPASLHRDEPVPVYGPPLREQQSNSEIPEQMTASSQADGAHPLEGEKAPAAAEPTSGANDALAGCLPIPTSRGPMPQSYFPVTSSPLGSPSTAPRAGNRTVFSRPTSACLLSADPDGLPSVSQRTSSPLNTPLSSARPTANPRPKSAYLLSSEAQSSPTRSSVSTVSSPLGCNSLSMSPPPPRFRLQKFRSADCLDRVDEVECLEASPPPSPPPPRFKLQKYRSADCLDRVDEAECLKLCPPPPKPMSYFAGSTNSKGQAATDNQSSNANNQNTPDEIFTSTEMLEKAGQPHFRKHLQQQGTGRCRPVSCFVGSASDESGYLSNATLGGSGWLGGLSASTGDILEILKAGGEEMNDEAADDELSFERAGSLRKAWSLCSLLRQDSIQDRSFTVMRKRRQKMKDRKTTNQRSSSTETDEGVDLKAGNSASSLLEEKRGGAADEEGGESSVVAGIPLDGKKRVPSSRRDQVVRRLHSVHMKAWEIRLRRKQMLIKRRSCDRLHPRKETLV